MLRPLTRMHGSMSRDGSQYAGLNSVLPRRQWSTTDGEPHIQGGVCLLQFLEDPVKRDSIGCDR
jgi:hypothetical protein